ncbi:MAG: DUF2974 domain-containing protein [Lachnospiraceae bacterium]|nr:DUF2974 domain-containing protein [Lachnospiraceae bacterium]
MNNIISYITEFGDRSLEEMPFNEVDSLVLCQLAYLDFSEYVGGIEERNTPVPVTDIGNDGDWEKILKGYWYRSDNKKLFLGFISSERFKDTRLNYYVNITSEDEDLQFSAVTFILPDKSVYIAYRGTDATLVGWKEDLKLAYSEPVRAQELSVDYLDRVSSYFTGQFRIGGHSKGGNLAVYAAMFGRSDCRKRITDIYDHDGPGFRPEIVKEGHYASIKNKIHKYIPRSSIVGILLETGSDYHVVECWSVGTFQHNTYRWKSKNGAFVYSKMTDKQLMNNEAINEWILSLSTTEVDVFIDMAYELLTANKAKNVFDLAGDPFGNAYSAFSRYREMDQKSKDMVVTIGKRLKEIMDRKTREKYTEWTIALKEEIRSWQEDALSLMNKAITKKKR